MTLSLTATWTWTYERECVQNEAGYEVKADIPGVNKEEIVVRSGSICTVE
jgi:HSP20 family molecular chaperone IbpA